MWSLVKNPEPVLDSRVGSAGADLCPGGLPSPTHRPWLSPEPRRLAGHAPGQGASASGACDAASASACGALAAAAGRGTAACVTSIRVPAETLKWTPVRRLGIS